MALGIHRRRRRNGCGADHLYRRFTLSAARRTATRCYRTPTSRAGSATLSGHGLPCSLESRASLLIYRAAYEQSGNTVSLWIEHSDRTAGAFAIPMTWFQSLNPLLVFLFTPFFVARWLRMAQRWARALPDSKDVARRAPLPRSATSCSQPWRHGAQRADRRRAGCGSWCFLSCTPRASSTSCRSGWACSASSRRSGSTRPTIAVWFLAAFAGNFLAGVLGAAWSHLSAAQFFVLTAAVAAASSAAVAAVRPLRSSSSAA